MRSLYLKIFVSFWLASILIIISTAWLLAPKWAGIILPLTIATLISALIAYLLSLYLTGPLRSFRQAVISLARGKLNTRVGHLTGHDKDEVDELSYEFDAMAERLETLIKSNQRLLQDISHELRSPIARLMLAIELCRKKCGLLANNEFDRMDKECLRLNALIDETLDFARLEYADTPLNKTWVDVPALIEKIISDANFEVSKNNVQVVLGQCEPCQALMDQKTMHRAIENVLRNALRYTPSHQTVIISVQNDKSEDHLVIDIKDHGPGVPDDQLVHIFNPFYRVDAAREKTTGGYGLGLAIAREAVFAHGGHIHAENRKEGGLLVRMLLPTLIEPS